MPPREAAQKKTLRYFAAALLVCLGLVLGFLGRGFLGSEPAPSGEAAAPDAAADTLWTCSMHPKIKQPDPGDCPICGMDLIPLDEAGATSESGPRELLVTTAAAALMNVRTSPVQRRFVRAQVRMVGKVAYDETRLAHITAWVPGRIERMFAGYEGIQVSEGDHMVALFSPELLAAKDELQNARKAMARLSGDAPASLRQAARANIEAVRNKLLRWGLTESQVDAFEQGEAPSDRITIYAPIGGTVIELHGQEGMYVETGTRIYTIANLAEVWVKLAAYESDLPWVHYGQPVEFRTESYPGEVFEGTVAFIAPEVDPHTRTVDVRVNVPNPDGALKPGMFVRGVVRSRVATSGRVMDPNLAGKWISPMHPEVVKDGPGTCDVCGMPLVPAEELGYVSADPEPADKPLVIPATAPLVTGKRAVVYVQTATAPPAFEGREVVLGPRAGEYYLVERGLREGERVVTHGNFKIDSALEIKAKPSMMTPMHEREAPGGPYADVRAEFRRALGTAYTAYLEVQDALAQDEPEQAAAAAKGLRDALEGDLGKPLEGAPAKAWRDTHAPALRDTAAALAAKTDLAEQRTVFEPVSEAFEAAVRDYGLPEGTSAFVVHCPMAFDDAGADWLQADGDEVRNPYFGSSMYRCGTVKERIAGTAETPDMNHAESHGGHAHE